MIFSILAALAKSYLSTTLTDSLSQPLPSVPSGELGGLLQFIQETTYEMSHSVRLYTKISTLLPASIVL